MSGEEFQMRVYQIMENDRLSPHYRLIAIAYNLYEGNPGAVLRIINQVKQEQEGQMSTETNQVLRCMVCNQETSTRSQKGECPACQLKKAQRCEHWVDVFCIVGTTVLIRCMNCDFHASIHLDGNNTFTTNGARLALSKVIEAMSENDKNE